MKNIFEYQDYTKDQTLKTQVCIIGSGCGGATLAKKLTDQGIAVIIVEKGGYYTAAQFDNRELNMAGKIDGERNLASTANGDTFLMFGSNVGGASVHYWADSYRTPTDRLLHWQNKYGIQNHAAEALTPAWDELDKTLNVHHTDPTTWGRMSVIFKEAVEKLGWEISPVYQARRNCQGSGHCMQGCFYNAKQSQLITHIPAALEKGAMLYADLQAEKFEFDGKRVKRLLASAIHRPSNKPSGVKITIEAAVFVVAAGGFQSAGFLLKQDNVREKLPALGKYFGMNPVAMSLGLYDEEIKMYRGVPAAWGLEQFRLATFDKSNQYVEGGYLLLPNQLHPAMTALSFGGYDTEMEEWMQNFNKIGSTIGWIDDVEDELGEVVLDNGRVKINYPYGKTTQLILKDLLKKQAMINFASGAKKVLIADYKGTLLNSINELNKIDKLAVTNSNLILAAPHPFGGCRMGNHATNSVVDATHRVHEFDNIFVADSSVFPTGPSVDPSYTIMAFSYIAAKYIGERF